MMYFNELLADRTIFYKKRGACGASRFQFYLSRTEWVEPAGCLHFRLNSCVFCCKECFLSNAFPSYRLEKKRVTVKCNPWKVRLGVTFLTFILKYNKRWGKVDPGVIILYNIPDDFSQKVILAVSKYQYQEQGTKSECCCWLWLLRAGDVRPAATACVLCVAKYSVRVEYCLKPDEFGVSTIGPVIFLTFAQHTAQVLTACLKYDSRSH